MKRKKTFFTRRIVWVKYKENHFPLIPSEITADELAEQLRVHSKRLFDAANFTIDNEEAARVVYQLLEGFNKTQNDGKPGKIRLEYL